MSSIIHFYKIDEGMSDQQVDQGFTERFLHIHFEGQPTLLVRKLSFVGEKLDPSGQELHDALTYIKNDPELKQALEDFLND